MWGGGNTPPSRSSQCPALDTPASVDLVALAELKGLRAVLQLLRRDEALVLQQPLEGGEPALVVARVLAARFGLGDLGDQLALELFPTVDAGSVEGDGHAEDAPFPRLLEHQLAILARDSRGPIHVGDEPVRCGV